MRIAFEKDNIQSLVRLQIQLHYRRSVEIIKKKVKEEKNIRLKKNPGTFF